MLTGKDYCDYETCVALKELGYVGSRQECECFGAYFNFGKDMFTDSLDNTEVGMNEYLRVPLYLAQKWLRNTHNLHISTKPYPCEDGLMWMYEIRQFTPYLVCVIKNKTGFREAEEALSEGVRTSIKILQDEQKENN